MLLADSWSEVENRAEGKGFDSMKTLRICIAGYGQMKTRTMAITRGEHESAQDEPKVWFTSVEIFSKVLSSRNRDLLALIDRKKSTSLTELAELSGREKSKLPRTLITMSRQISLN